MKSVLRPVLSRTLAAVAAACMAGGSAAAFESYDGRAGYDAAGQYRSQQQYPPAQPTYQQSYNYGANDPYRRQYDYGQSPSYGSPQGYQPQPYGYAPPDAAGDPSRHDPSGDAGVPRIRRHRLHRVSRDFGGSDRPPSGRGTRVRTVLTGTGVAIAAPQTGGWFAYGQVAACVRTCDGYFFPMGLVSDQTSLEGQKSLCTALCPGAKTELYFMAEGSDGIAAAVTADGRPYSKMPHALRYTKAVDAACTCRANRGQARLVSLMKDFTLRRGDAVMTVNGVLVFNGAWRWPYTLNDFQVLDKAKYYLSNAVALAALETAALRTGPQARPTKPDGKPAEQVMQPLTFIKDTTGKTVRLVGEALANAPAPLPATATLPPAATIH